MHGHTKVIQQHALRTWTPCRSYNNGREVLTASRRLTCLHAGLFEKLMIQARILPMRQSGEMVVRGGSRRSRSNAQMSRSRGWSVILLAREDETSPAICSNLVPQPLEHQRHTLPGQTHLYTNYRLKLCRFGNPFNAGFRCVKNSPKTIP